MAEMSDEQRKALMEKLKNMSPEELKEFQKKQCIFCQIVAGGTESKKVYEDDKSIAILDINPANAGHILLMPREHYAIMPQVPDDELRHLGIVSKHLSLALLKGLKAGGTSIFVANGLAAGQRAQHFMVHVIPRTDKDGVGLAIPQKEISEDELRKLREALQNKINALLGIKKEIVIEKSVDKSKAASEEKPAQQPPAREEENPQEKKRTKGEKKPVGKGDGKTSLDDIAALFG